MSVIIGLEIHVQLGTRTKLFCGDAVRHGEAPNTDVCPVCLGLPGALPVLNARAVELAVRAATLLECEIHRTSRFVRKNYFYPDLPKGYQITQLEEPLATGGRLMLDDTRSVRLSRVHLEEDAGKLLHDRIPGRTAVDLNRCGIPLLEIVTEPDLRSAADAAMAAREVKRLLQYAGISECDMELGELRIDANVSLTGGDVRTEIKNINSFAHLERAIDREIERQQGIMGAGGVVERATLAWDDHAAALRVMRTKEERAEYRYMAEPDLPPLRIDDALIERAMQDVPELPRARTSRFRDILGLSHEAARALAATRAVADYFDAVVTAGAPSRGAAAWVLGDVLAWCNTNGRTIAAYPVQARDLADIVTRVEARELTRDGGRAVLHALIAGENDVAAAIERSGAGVPVDVSRIDALVDAVIAEQGALVQRYRAGEANLFGFLMGTVMSRAGTSADPRVVADHLRTRLHE